MHPQDRRDPKVLVKEKERATATRVARAEGRETGVYKTLSTKLKK
jgi:hypothetical protein